ncbi:MarR family winged helix-turn-helix transcriptional regulator [Polyangium fumosum]|uniref:MarR family transcriptional regulator n=1 Tax=Polyangium fumosum TaxID=889272 RepID=A0A4U1JCJ2_9BACT|nr:MarR family transcriptional regulator [Polyangium fumosum]TKD08349.1 MarR family transcriptional regulator [Polyangium fumosum]
MRRGAPTRRPVSAQPTGKGEQNPAVRAWVRILAVQKAALAAIRDDLEHEMTLPRFDLLSNLVRENGQTLASLSRSMLVTAGNITGLVDRAARDGLVERRADPNDRRAWRVHLTPKGQLAFQRAERRHAARVSKLFSALSGNEMSSLVRMLDKVRHTLHGPELSAVRGPRGEARRTPERGTGRRRARAKTEDDS